MSRENEIYKVTIIGGLANVCLLMFKFVAGFVGHSSAMLADAVHSFSDFATDVIVLVFVKISGKPKDESHDYGHGKFETLATSVIGLALFVVAVGIFYSGVQKIVFWAKGGVLLSPGMLAFWAAIASIVVKETVYRYTIAAGRRLDSQAVIANAWHHRSDALSSIGTAVGIGGAIFLSDRWAVLDPIASVVVSIFIFKVSWDLVKGGVGELMEKSLPDDVEREIIELVESSSHPLKAHNLRTRRIGSYNAIEMHISLPGDMSLEESHSIATDVENRLYARFGKETIISIHVEPLGDEDHE